MCGIVGFLDAGSPVPSDSFPRLIEGMTDLLAHRGPDGSGSWIDPLQRIALGHRRLAILDLTSPSAKQPMLSPGGRFVLTFNGEIYNYPELRNVLEQEHATPSGGWKTSSDTEVFLSAIEEWGLETAIARAVGMFAFALWDRREKRLFLVRDRLGEKPLYYGHCTNVFFFASELKALYPHPAFTPSIDPTALAAFLRRGNIPAPLSIFRDISKLEPGTMAVMEASHSSSPPVIHRYWSLAAEVENGAAEAFLGSEEEATDLLEEKLRIAIRGTMRSDVPLGVLLSGGIDSSTVAALMQEESSRPISTFTIGFPDVAFNEAPHASAVARTLGTNHHELIIGDSEARSVIPLLPSLYDEPFADSSQIPTFLVARMAKAHVTVALTGDGGDELLGGYNRHVFAHRFRHVFRHAFRHLPASWKHASAVLLRRFAALFRAHPFAEHLFGQYLSHPAEKLDKIAWALKAHSMEDLYVRIIESACAGAINDPSEISGTSGISIPGISGKHEKSRVFPAKHFSDPAEYFQFRDATEYLPDDILVKIDRAGMSVGLETRMPFLDHRLAAFAWRLPLNMKIRKNTGKWLLRRVLSRHLALTLTDRPKAGFAVPLHAWLCGPLRTWAEDLLRPSRLREEGFLSASSIQAALNETMQGISDRSAFLWNALMFQAWHEEFRKKQNAP
ncbi:MAG: asparagine synthase (glutamine-hydrolyzing) [Candidatus Ozemobacteraceae bacterium]